MWKSNYNEWMDSKADYDILKTRWQEAWRKDKVGSSDTNSAKPTYSTAIAPPNITGQLHLGHTVQQSVQDILARFHRMNGYNVEWTPGVDHAALPTQNVIEKQLISENSSKDAIGKEAFLERAYQWYEQVGGQIYGQMEQLGFTPNWDHKRFTLDEEYVLAIRTVFKQLYEEGLIYKGPRMVNWCSRCESAISDEEVQGKENKGQLVHLNYALEGAGGTITIATTRPETIFADVAVAVNPEDERYKHLVGQSAYIPIINKKIPIIADEAVKINFGTGALKITPAHDHLDYEIGLRHNLPVTQIVDKKGQINFPEVANIHGLSVAKARTWIIGELEILGAVEKIVSHDNIIGTCDRCKTIIEPLISTQTWVKMDKLAGPAIKAVKTGEIKFHPAKHQEEYLAWLNNLQDWCISRQIWLGHQIPLSTCANGHEFAWTELPTNCPTCETTKLKHDEDVLDTWFSSGLWPFAIHGWPTKTPELERFYPTDAIVTAKEIIFLWIGRMVMLGYHFTGKAPFSDIVINTTILNKKGKRMSKSDPTSIVNPLDMIAQYNPDAVRAWAAWAATSGQAVKFDEEKIKAYQNFTTKVWNATRFLITNTNEQPVASVEQINTNTTLAMEDKWILDKLNKLILQTTENIKDYKFQNAINNLYDFIWHDFCDVYLELSKEELTNPQTSTIKTNKQQVMSYVLLESVKLLHPFMPYITEELAQALGVKEKSLDKALWPQANYKLSAKDVKEIELQMKDLLQVAEEIRSLQAALGVKAQKHNILWKQPIRVQGPLNTEAASKLLSRLASVQLVAEEKDNFQLEIVANKNIIKLQIPAMDELALAQVAFKAQQLNRQLLGLNQKLANQEFVNNAGEQIVRYTKSQQQNAQKLMDMLLKVVPANWEELAQNHQKYLQTKTKEGQRQTLETNLGL